MPSASRVIATASGPPASRTWASGWTPSSHEPAAGIRGEDPGQVAALVEQLGRLGQLASRRESDEVAPARSPAAPASTPNRVSAMWPARTRAL